MKEFLEIPGTLEEWGPWASLWLLWLDLFAGIAMAKSIYRKLHSCFSRGFWSFHNKYFLVWNCFIVGHSLFEISNADSGLWTGWCQYFHQILFTSLILTELRDDSAKFHYFHQRLKFAPFCWPPILAFLRTISPFSHLHCFGKPLFLDTKRFSHLLPFSLVMDGTTLLQHKISLFWHPSD